MESAIKYSSKIAHSLKIMGSENLEALQSIINEKKGKQTLIGTHSGAFHCDEVLATSMLLHTKEFADSMIIRTRDEPIIDQLDIVCDVGGSFDVEKKRFDHHQKSFSN